MQLKVSYPLCFGRGSIQWALLIGSRCHAQGCGETEREAHVALVTEARELHAALGPWLAEQDAKGGK